MAAPPSMVTRVGENLVVQSVVSGDTLYGTSDENLDDCDDISLMESLEPEDDFGELPQCKIKRNYSCTICDYYTQNPRYYLYHQKEVHNEKIKIYECPNCLYASKHSQKLQRHIHMVHVMGAGKKKVVKSKAGKVKTEIEGFYTEENGTVEPEPVMRAPDGTDIYKCSVCDMTNKSLSMVNRHERLVHLKRKFYRCAKCNYVTHMKARYTKHVKYHSMPMIKCEMCDFRTPYKWNLDRHNKNHQGDGAFKCSLCNFTADIKQSLTVHEMNHHIPPLTVGQGVITPSNRRRLKVGASDSLGLVTEEDQIEQEELELLRLERESAYEQVPADFVETQIDGTPTSETCPTGGNSPQSDSMMTDTKPSPNFNAKELTVKFGDRVLTDEEIMAQKMAVKKYKCRVCDFRTGTVPEIQLHEQTVHGVPPATEKKKVPRPIPNLIPIQGPSVKPPAERKTLLTNHHNESMSEKDMNDLCAKSRISSSLKDFAPIMCDGDPFANDESHGATIESGASSVAGDPKKSPSPNSMDSQSEPKKSNNTFKMKNALFFHRLQEKLMTSATGTNMTCSVCGYEAKCLSELVKHQKTHSEFSEDQNEENSMTESSCYAGELSSTRCQHCRQRCKTSSDLMVHLQSCPVIQKKTEDERDDEDAHSDASREMDQGAAHPMENKVFVWNWTNEEEDPDDPDDQEPSADEIAKDLPVDGKSFVGVEVRPGYGTATVESGQTSDSAKQMKDLTTKKVYKCPHCSFWASTASRFHVHIVGHLNKRPFQCSLCCYSSNWRWDITKHIRLKSARDPAHESARVLLTDETGRRNYSKYNKYLTTMHMEVPLNRPRKILPKEPPLSGKMSNSLNNKSDSEEGDDRPKKKLPSDNKKTMWKCKKCLFRNSDRNVVLDHVKNHYRNATDPNKTLSNAEASANEEQRLNEDSNEAPKAVSEAQSEDDEVHDCPDFMCETCPFIGTSMNELEMHAEKHFVTQGTSFKCQFCPYYADNKEELMEHLDLHNDIEVENNGNPDSKLIVFACLSCPYIASNRQQLGYHRRWHNAKDADHKCFRCSYAAPNNIILSLHCRVHGRGSFESNIDPICTKKKEKVIADISGIETSHLSEIPVFWVSKPTGISKMFKCRYCPHVNMRKSNIQEHEKMHALRAPSTTASGAVLQHHCPDCNYVCNNAGVLSSHAKVHQAFYGQVCMIADPARTDEEQLDEVKRRIAAHEATKTPLTEKEDEKYEDESDIEDEKVGDRIIHFCPVCPARFLFEKELMIHSKFHDLKFPFSCTSCSYTARQKQHLLAHLKVHTDDYQERTNSLCDTYQTSEEHPRPKVAIILGEAEGSDSVWVVVTHENNENLSPAKSDKSPSKPFTCHKCPAEFIKNVALTYHLTLHGGPGPHKCRSCDYAVKTYGNLIKHEAVHNKLEPRVKMKPKPKSFLETVPTSGTELFRHKTEAQKTPPKQPPPTPQPLAMDPEFGILIHGSPEFVYPMYMKNGKMKEKRYKCHKCPSAFEKREQYKIHLSLHGSKQRYNCERCDYSVKYYANYSQHMKKHEMNDASQKEKKITMDRDDEDEMETAELEKDLPVAFVERGSKSLKMSLADHQSVMLVQQRVTSNSVVDKGEPISRCPYCPYAINRKDGVNNHIKCHLSPKDGSYTCKYCDYSVPQLHFLREHTKVHFAPIKFLKPEAYMKCDRIELWAEPVDPNHNMEKSLIFKDKGANFKEKERFLPKVESMEMSNVKGRVYINLKTGEEEVEMDEEKDESDPEVDEMAEEGLELKSDNEKSDDEGSEGLYIDEKDIKSEDEGDGEMAYENGDEGHLVNGGYPEITNGVVKSLSSSSSDSEDSSSDSTSSSSSQQTSGTNVSH